MRILHILRSQPDESVRRLIEAASAGLDAVEVALYAEAPDYRRLVEEVFARDRVICWW